MPGEDESSTASTCPGEDEPPTLVTIGDDELCCVLAQATFTSLTHFKAAASRFGPFCRRMLATDARFAAARAVFAGGDTRALTRDVLCVSLLQNDDVWSTEAVLRVRLPLPMPGAASYRGGFSWSYDPDPPSLPCSDCRKPFPDGSLRLSTGGTVRCLGCVAAGGVLHEAIARGVYPAHMSGYASLTPEDQRLVTTEPLLSVHQPLPRAQVPLAVVASAFRGVSLPPLPQGCHALHLARSAEMVALLVDEFGADPDRRRANGCTPLMDACAAGEPAVVRALCARGASPHLRDTPDGETALRYAERAPTGNREWRGPPRAEAPDGAACASVLVGEYGAREGRFTRTDWYATEDLEALPDEYVPGFH